MKRDPDHSSSVAAHFRGAAYPHAVSVRLLRSLAFVFALLLVSGGAAHAQFNWPRFVPDPAVTGQPVVYRQSFSLCYEVPAENLDGEQSWLSVDGNEIRFFGVYRPLPCPVIPPGPPVDFNLGFLPAGEYTFFQYQVPSSVSFPVDPAEFNPRVQTSITVVQGGPRPVPGLTR